MVMTTRISTSGPSGVRSSQVNVTAKDRAHSTPKVKCRQRRKGRDECLSSC